MVFGPIKVHCYGNEYEMNETTEREREKTKIMDRHA